LSVSYGVSFALRRAPPGSTLFPYTTLFRSGIFEAFGVENGLGLLNQIVEGFESFVDAGEAHVGHLIEAAEALGDQLADHLAGNRSEEHTSELQSLAYLVCRLLLEKKKSNLR